MLLLSKMNHEFDWSNTMKIYIVTSGTYSDYCIRRVFTNKEKAEEYREWLHGSNEVEEYDTSDDMPTEKKYCVYVDLKWYPDKSEETVVSAYKNTESDFDYQTYTNYNTWEEIIVVRNVSAGNYDEQHWKDKFTKVAYDLKANVEFLKTEGLSYEQIKDEIYNYNKS